MVVQDIPGHHGSLDGINIVDPFPSNSEGAIEHGSSIVHASSILYGVGGDISLRPGASGEQFQGVTNIGGNQYNYIATPRVIPMRQPQNDNSQHEGV